MTKHLESYLAGVFDGEGFISAQFTRRSKKNSRQHTRLIVGVGMKYKPIPELFQKQFGGSLRSYKTKNGSLIYNWYVCGRNCEEVLRFISKFCLEKSEQAKYALELSVLLGKQAVRGKRPRGSQLLSNNQIDKREELCNIITSLKQ